MTQIAEKVYVSRLEPPPQARRVPLAARVRYYLPTVIIFVGVLIFLELAVRLLGITKFILPAPSAILQAFVSSFDQLANRGLYTGYEAVGGFVAGCGLGILVSLATARWTAARETLLPVAIAANSVPMLTADANGIIGIRHQR